MGSETEKQAIERLRPKAPDNPALEFLASTADNAVKSSQFVRDAAAGYRTPVDYGIGGLSPQLRQVAALIHAGMPTRLYYVSYQGNSFDTHVHQADPHARLLAYTADAVRGFMEDLKRISRVDDVAIMMFTEFGRRVEENASLGTDHGTATPMFVIGSGVEGGLHGRHPSLTDLDDGNLKMTTDFRRVYASMIEEWLGFDDTGRFSRARSSRCGCSLRPRTGGGGRRGSGLETRPRPPAVDFAQPPYLLDQGGPLQAQPPGRLLPVPAGVVQGSSYQLALDRGDCTRPGRSRLREGRARLPARTGMPAAAREGDRRRRSRSGFG